MIRSAPPDADDGWLADGAMMDLLGIEIPRMTGRSLWGGRGWRAIMVRVLTGLNTIEMECQKENYVTMDGNTAAAYASCFTEVAGIYPITPHPNGGQVDQ